MDGGLDGCIEEYIMSAIQGAGGQPQKSPRYAPIYTGRVFNGLYTNRSPLRGAASALLETFYKLNYGDVMIAGANVEVSNRLTLVRRPGNPEFSANSYTDIQAFDEFRINKAAADAFGTTLEEIFTMISEPGALYAEMNGTNELVFADAAAQGQTYMQAIGNSLYFSNGIDNKKWLQSLITWAPNFQLQGSTGTQGTYPFLSTYLLTGSVYVSEDIQQIQQLVGVAVANITEVAVAGDVLTLTIATVGNPTGANGAKFPLDLTTPTFQIWGVETATWLNGATITAKQAVTIGMTTYVTAAFVPPTADAAYGPTADTGYLQQIGSTPVVGITGSTEPTWGTYGDYTDNASPYWGALVGANPYGGNFVLDGNLLWVNRGLPVENWGIAAPNKVTATETGTAVSGWKPSVYYSAPGIIVDTRSAQTNIWQVTTQGTTGGTISFPTSPSVGDTHTDGTAVWTCVANTASVTWAANTPYSGGGYAGSSPWTPGSITIDGDIYSVGQYIPDWQSGSFIIYTVAGQPCVFMAQQNIPGGNVFQSYKNAPGSPTDVPISVVHDGAYPGSLGWTVWATGNGGFSVGLDGINNLLYGGSVGTPKYPDSSSPTFTKTNGVSSLLYNFYDNGAGDPYDARPMKLSTVGSNGVMVNGTYTTPVPSNDQFLQFGKIRIPTPGMSVALTLVVSGGVYFGIDPAATATLTSFSAMTGPLGSPTGLTTSGFGGGGVNGIVPKVTPYNGYPIFGGYNLYANGLTMTFIVNFPNAGVFGIEFCYGEGSAGVHNLLYVIANGFQIVPEASTTPETAPFFFESCGSTPAFPASGTSLAAQNTYPSIIDNTPSNAPYPAADTTFPKVINGACLSWFNLGPTTNFTWPANTLVTLPTTTIIDVSSSEEDPYVAGVSGATAPIWNTGLYALTSDTLVAGTLQWINEGGVPLPPNVPGQITAVTGWYYWIALVNTLDQTVSNCGPVSATTGPVLSGQVTIAPGSGIDVSTLDPQVDYVAIFRSTDGGATPLLNPGLGNSIWTVPLTQYLQNGFVDTTPDLDLDTEIEGAVAGENTPPQPGAVNLTYHLSRGWYSVGNTVWYTSGPDAPAGNGNGTSPLNFDVMPSRVVRLVPTAIGMLVYTTSDIYIIAGNGTANNPILPAVPYLTGVGLANYNALDINGALIGFFTTDKQFLIFDPSAGLSYVGYPIGDQLRLNNGNPGQSWNTSTVCITWYTNGEDQAWFLGDGHNGWYKLIATPAPETGNSWSPFATIALSNPSVGGISALRSIETSPGVHNLLLGPSGTGNILYRNLDATTDGGTTGANGTPYPAYGVFGSYVLALPGQIAKIAFVTTVSVRVGSPLIIGLLLDEALPYYKGSFDILKKWETDPPNVPESKSFYRQRFYLSDDDEYTAYCNDMQLLVQWPAEASQSELQSFSVFGAYEIEA